MHHDTSRMPAGVNLAAAHAGRLVPHAAAAYHSLAPSLVKDDLMPSAASDVRWHLRPELAARSIDLAAIDRWLADGSARIVKQGPQRTIYHVDRSGFAFFVKRHHLPDTTTWLRQSLRTPKARREYKALEELGRRGVPVPEPLGWGAAPGLAGESLLVTRALEDVGSLSGFLLRPEGFSAAERQRLAPALARFLAQLHAAGAQHRDLHPGNILVRTSGGDLSFFLVDLDALELGEPLNAEVSEANLALFNAWFVPGAGRPERLRFLAAYAEARGWLDAAADLRGPKTLCAMARRIEIQTQRYCLAFWARRDRRCLESNRYYRRIETAMITGHATRTLEPAWIEKFARDPDALFRESNARFLKDSPSSTVAVIEAIVDGVSREVILKRFLVTRSSDPWVALVRATPALRSWIMGQGLLERGMPTARPLAVLHRRRGGLVREAYLVTEKLEHVEDLSRYVARLASMPIDVARPRLLRQLDRVARAVRELHGCQLSHRDLKAANLLVTAADVEETPAGAARPVGTISVAAVPTRLTNLWFIDLVGCRTHRRLGKRRRVQNLARLNASFLLQPLVSRTDRLRFLRIYLGWGIHGKGAWKAWWRAVAAATDSKIARNQRSGRILS